LRDPDGQGHPVLFINVPEPKVVKNRVHLDLITDQPMSDEVNRLVAAGARAIMVHQHPPGYIDEPYEWTVMQDPEGNEFCVGRPVSPT
jgi:hypothetical protein